MEDKIFMTVVIIFCTIAIIVVGYTLSIPMLFVMGDISQGIEKKSIEKEVKKLTSTYLQEKYPERNFEMSNEELEISELYNGFMHAGWDSRVYINFKDNKTGLDYRIFVDTNSKVCKDFVQLKDIEESIKEKLEEIVKIDSDKIKIVCTVSDNHGFNLDEKFNGDIVEFLKTLKKDDENIGIKVFCVYVNGTMKFFIDNTKNSELLELLDGLYFINLKNYSDFNSLNFYYSTNSKDLLKRNILFYEYPLKNNK